ncbi:MAG: MBL fold metallo-hydrolase [Candidatus Aenigmatarchaeota archaeon]
MKIKIVYDNEAEPPFESDWEFSALIEDEVKILFDTGDKGGLLKKNLKRLDVDISSIDKVILSHEHHDHTGGLFSVIEGSTEVYLLRSSSERLKDKIRESRQSKLIEVDDPMEVSDGAITTGEIGKGPAEQSLLLDHNGKNILLTGCAHPGLSEIIEAASRLGEVKGVIGGFHGFDEFEALKDLSLIIPCHCTEHKEKIKRRFPERSMDCYAGLELELENE